MVQLFGHTTIAQGAEALESLVAEFSSNALTRNEAETRFHLIDSILMQCLGWPKSQIHVEVAEGRSYTDYELGHPRQVIVEAKKEGRTFELPANPSRKLLQDLPSLLALGGELKAAIDQVQEYCSRRGTPIACACNGHQFVVFLAVRTDGHPPLEGRCLVIESLEHLRTNFARFWQYLSPEGVAERRLARLLTTGIETAIPPKLSSRLITYPKIRYQSDVQATLRQLSELLIQDVVEHKDVEAQFFRECYCESGALSQHALVSKNILEARYAAMFSDREQNPRLTPVNAKRGTPALTPEVMTEALTQRPIVLIGDVGVGKTSFVKHLMYVSAYEEFKNALYIYIDLGSQAALAESLESFVLDDIERQLLEKYELDVYSLVFTKGVYASEISRFAQGIHGGLKERDPAKYEDKLSEMLESLLKRKDEHLKRSIQHLAKARKKQIIIAIDNADQRSFDVQQAAFIVAQNLAKSWSAAVFLSLRPQTFYKSKQAGAFTAYPHKVFTIAPPRVNTVVEKRLTFALNMAEGRVPVEILSGAQINIKSLSLFIKCLLLSLGKNDDLAEYLSNITGGNIRAVIELVTKFIGSANVDADKIISQMERDKRYIIPIHEFSKPALLGEYSHFHPETSVAMNLFDVRHPDPREHFLVCSLIAFLDFDGRHKDKDGFVSSTSIFEEMQSVGYSPQQIQAALRRTTNKKLIETSQRVTFAEDETGLVGEIPESFRITTVGAYHFKRWMPTFAYLDAMAFDTPIFNTDMFNNMSQRVESLDIADRLDRTECFRNYLTKTWNESAISLAYFDFEAIITGGEETFLSVKRAVSAIRNN